MLSISTTMHTGQTWVAKRAQNEDQHRQTGWPSVGGNFAYYHLNPAPCCSLQKIKVIWTQGCILRWLSIGRSKLLHYMTILYHASLSNLSGFLRNCIPCRLSCTLHMLLNNCSMFIHELLWADILQVRFDLLSPLFHSHCCCLSQSSSSSLPLDASARDFEQSIQTDSTIFPAFAENNCLKWNCTKLSVHFFPDKWGKSSLELSPYTSVTGNILSSGCFSQDPLPKHFKVPEEPLLCAPTWVEFFDQGRHRIGHRVCCHQQIIP